MRESKMVSAGYFLALTVYTVVAVTEISKAECPQNCICYADYITNLASWKWIEPKDSTHENEKEDENFNPYLEHNEVYNSPLTEFKKKTGSLQLRTVTCIIRNTESSTLSETLEEINVDVQVLSLLQAPGSGNISLTLDDMLKFRLLMGLELQGVSRHQGDHQVDTFHLEADALSKNQNLVYLNLEKVLIHQKPATKESVLDDVYIKLSRVPAEESNDVSNDIKPQLLYLAPKEQPENEVVSYSDYKEGKLNDSFLQEVSFKRLPQTDVIEPKISVAFTKLSNLVHLRIAGCEMLDISWDMFYKLNKLKYLLLDKNELLFLPDFVFYATPNLTALSLSGNRILNLQTVGLAGLLYLEKLDVTHNNITHLSELSLPPFPHLQIADFRYNPIETIFPNTFEIMNTTTTLLLGSPTVPLEFVANSFFGLSSLTRLEILNVRVGTLERPMFKGMPMLKYLTMDGSIPRISYDAFSEIPRLEKLVLRKCGLRKISMDAFFGVTSLLELDLSHNELSVLPPGIFDDQSSLQELYLSHNRLTTLPPGIFSRLPAKMIRLEHNLWHCSCDMADWNPKVINKIRTYYIPKNMTHCQPQYDKGSMCTVDAASFQVKYVYEKRVAPTCASPVKHMQKSVFQAVKKGLHNCIPMKKSSKTTYTQENNTAMVTPEKIRKPKPEADIPKFKSKPSSPTIPLQAVEESTKLRLTSHSQRVGFPQTETQEMHPRFGLSDIKSKLKAKMKLQLQGDDNSKDSSKGSNSFLPSGTHIQTNNPIGAGSLPLVSKKSLKFAKQQRLLVRS